MTVENKSFLKALYLVGALLLVFGLVDPLTQAWPPRLGDTRWRFGAAGMFSTGVLWLVLGLVWTMVLAYLLEQRRTLRVSALAGIALAVGLVGGLGLFGLDFLQVRAYADPRVRPMLERSVIKSLIVVSGSIGTLLVVGIAGWRAGRRLAAQAVPAGRGPGIVYRQGAARRGEPQATNSTPAPGAPSEPGQPPVRV